MFAYATENRMHPLVQTVDKKNIPFISIVRFFGFHAQEFDWFYVIIVILPADGIDFWAKISTSVLWSWLIKIGQSSPLAINNILCISCGREITSPDELTTCEDDSVFTGTRYTEIVNHLHKWLQSTCYHLGFVTWVRIPCHWNAGSTAICHKRSSDLHRLSAVEVKAMIVVIIKFEVEEIFR